MSKVLVITGGSSGIGLATARRFQEAGYRVINLSRSDIDPSVGTQIKADLSQANWLEHIGGELLNELGTPDQIALINNASLLLKDSIRDASADMGKVLQINVVAAQQLSEFLLPKMSPGSSIHFVGSTLSEKAVGNTLSYVTSKHATLGLMRATCQDLMGSAIHCTCVCPGFTDTEMLRSHVGNDQSILDSIATTTGFNRLAKPEEIAETLFFAANNPVLNGAALHANLGQREN